MDDAKEAWLEREHEIVEEALEAARAYQHGLPEDSDFIQDFFERLERSVDERDFFIKSYRERHSDQERIVDRADVRHPDDVGEMFCDRCESFRMSLYAVENAAYCESCYEDLDLGSQGSLKDYGEGKSVYALIGCGSEKKDRAGMMPAKELYDSSYFDKKLAFGEELCDYSLIVSAKFGLIHPETAIWHYDASIEDVDVDRWMDMIEENLDSWPDWEEGDEVWVLVGERYLDAEASDGRSLRKLLYQAPPEIRCPFSQTSGIGKQLRYLDEAVKSGEPAMPHTLDREGQTGLDSW